MCATSFPYLQFLTFVFPAFWRRHPTASAASPTARMFSKTDCSICMLAPPGSNQGNCLPWKILMEFIFWMLSSKQKKQTFSSAKQRCRTKLNRSPVRPTLHSRALKRLIQIEPCRHVLERSSGYDSGLTPRRSGVQFPLGPKVFPIIIECEVWLQLSGQVSRLPGWARPASCVHAVPG